MSAWTAVDNEIIRSPKLTVYEKVVLAVIKSHIGNGGTAWPSQATIAKEANCSRAQVARAISSLESLGLLAHRNNGRGKVSTYQESSIPQIPLDEKVVSVRDTSSIPQIQGSIPQIHEAVSGRDTKKTNRTIPNKKTKEEEGRVISPEDRAKLLEAFGSIWGIQGTEERIAECLAYPFARTKNRNWYLTARTWLRNEQNRSQGYAANRGNGRTPPDTSRDISKYFVWPSGSRDTRKTV